MLMMTVETNYGIGYKLYAIISFIVMMMCVIIITLGLLAYMVLLWSFDIKSFAHVKRMS